MGLTQHQQISTKFRDLLRRKYGIWHSAIYPHDKMRIQHLIPMQGKSDLCAASKTIVRLQHISQTKDLDNGTEQEEFIMDVYEDGPADEDFGGFPMIDDNSDNSVAVEEITLEQSDEWVPTAEIIDNFNEHVEWARSDLLDFTTNVKNAITLMSSLRKTKASSDTYETVIDWHFCSTGSLLSTQQLSDCRHFISREKLFKQLRQQYNYKEGSYHNVDKITLPHSRSRVNIVWNDANAVIQSLLTDPRITGHAHVVTYKKMIKHPHKQILLPVMFYIDGANTGQFVDLPLTAVKISLGIFARKARDKDHMWGALGYIPAYSKHLSRGQCLFVESHHMDSIVASPLADQTAGGNPIKTIPKAQDLHCMLQKVFASYIKLQKTGFKWDPSYKNKLHKDIKFVLFTLFIKVDSDEAEKLCGKFTSRTGNVSMLCRYCQCPTKDSDKPFVRYEVKNVPLIKGMTEADNVEGLRKLSQHCIKNLMHNIRFGLHNNHGIHGACPMDMLHALLFGMFRCIRDCFFEQIGPNSKLSDELNAWARQYGDFISRQSDRDFPKKSFASGILRGKLNAKDFPRILLCMAITLRCGAVRRLLPRRRHTLFNNNVLNDWQLLIDTLLQWEQWIKRGQMEIDHVKKLELKHCHLIYLMKKVGRRVQGMGLKIAKFHSIVHLTNDILNFGVPLEVDTGSNESGHKVEKTAAKLTQKKKEFFDIQTARRLEEVHLIDLAMEEIKCKKLWNYDEDCRPTTPQIEKIKATRVGGVKYYVKFSEELQKNVGVLKTKKKGNQEMIIEQDILNYVINLQSAVVQFIPKLFVHSIYNRDEYIFRASSNFMKNAWQDWAVFDWGDEGQLPCHIMGFLDLASLPANFSFDFAGIDCITRGIYAIVETSTHHQDEASLKISELFIPIKKKIGGYTGNFVSHRIFLLADCNAIVSPIAVVPNIGGGQNEYFEVKPRAKWREDFISWLESPMREEDLDLSDDEISSGNKQENFGSDRESDNEESAVDLAEEG